MSIWSDYKCGALTDEEFRDECIKMNLQDRYEREHMYDKWFDEDEEEDEEEDEDE